MNIAMDASTAIRQLGGISEYTYQLLVALGALQARHEYYLATVGWDTSALGALPRLPRNFHHHPIRLPLKLAQLGWRYLNEPKITRFLPPHDLFFAPHFLLPAGTFPRLVVAIHDVLFLDHPEWFLPADVRLFSREVVKAARQADQILTISEASRERILAHGLASAERVHVIPLGVALQPANPVAVAAMRQRLKIPKEYLLYLGTIEPRKNVLRILEAYARARQSGVTVPLLFAGRRGWIGGEFETKIRDLGLEAHVRVLGSVSRDDRCALLTGALLVLFPSLAEGFGLPVLEGMAVGTPVITSNTSSLPEVAGDAAVLVDPYNVSLLADAILGLVNDPAQRASLVERGRLRAQDYTWIKTAKATTAVFESVL